MKTAVIYATTYGTTEKVANYIAEKLPEVDMDTVELKAENIIDLSSYETVMLGASVYLGDIQQVMSDFCRDNLDALLTKRIGLFVCGMEPELIRQDAELEMAFPRVLYQHAQATAFVGGEVDMEKLNSSQEFITKNLLGFKQSASFIRYDLIDIFIYQMELASE